MPNFGTLDTSLMPKYESGADTALKLGQIGYLNTQQQALQISANAVAQKAMRQQQNAALLAAAQDPAALPDASNSTLGSLHASAIPGTGPNPLINRTGAPVDGVPTLGAVGTQPGQPAAPPDLSPAGVRQRYFNLATSKQIPAEIIDATLKTLDSNTAAAQNEIKLKAASNESRDRDILDKAFADAQGDPKATMELALKSGASPAALDAFQSKTTLAQQHLATLTKDQLTNVQTGHDAMRGSLMAFIKLPMIEKTNGWHDFVQQQVASGHLSKEEAAGVSPSYPGDVAAQTLANSLATGTQLAKEEIERRTADREDEQLKATKARDAQNAKPKTMAELAIVANDPNATQEARAQAKGAMKDITRETIAGRPVTNNNIIAAETARGVVSPEAQAAANGKMSPATLRARLRSTPALMGQILLADPEFDEGNIEKRYAVLKEFSNSSTGKAGGQVVALNTLIHHADLYLATAEALKNKTFVPGNAVYNAVASAFGAAPPTNAALVARFFAGETGKVATGGVPAEGEINGILHDLGTSASPDQIAGAGTTLLGIAAGKMIPLKEKVADAKLEALIPVLGPDAQTILARRGFDPETLQPHNATPGQGGSGVPPVLLKDGTTLTPHDAAAAAAFRRDHPELIK